MTTKLLSRRTVLRGAGISLALPLLEAMQPARARGAALDEIPPRRLVFIYASTGVAVPSWTPIGEGADYRLSPTLQPLETFKKDFLVLSGLDHRREDRAANEHDMASSTLLSTAPIGLRDRATYATGISVDQVVAGKIGDRTRLPSLELGCDADSSRMHISNVSWRGPALPMGREFRPRQAFARMFGDPRADAYRRSILDYMQGSARRLQAGLGTPDRRKLGEYFESIRAIEKRIAAAERHARTVVPPVVKLPEGVPGDFSEHLKLMADLLVLAIQSDVTRVATFMFANESDDHAFPQLGIPEGHHTLSHYNPATAEGKDQLAKLQKVDQFYVEHFRYLLEKLKAAEGDGTLLDNSLVVYASGLSYPNKHSRIDIPVLLAGRGGGTVDPGRHVRHPAGTPFSNLLLSLTDRMGVPLARVSDSTGRLTGLTT